MEITLQKNGLAKTMKTGFSIEYLFFGMSLPYLQRRLQRSI